MQQNGLNICHIESKRSKHDDSEYEIYVNLEAKNGENIPIPQLVKSLKRQFSYIKIDDRFETSSTGFKKGLGLNKEPSIDWSVMTNSNGELIRKSNKNSWLLKQ